MYRSCLRRLKPRHHGTLWIALLLSASLCAQAEDCGARHPDAPSELLQFGFLIGPWDCEIDWLRLDGTRSQGRGTWTGRWMMDGWAIQDDFRGGFYEGFVATTFRAWDAQEKGWRGYWLDGRSGRWSRPLVQEKAGRGLRLRTSTAFRDTEGQRVEVELRYHFHEIADRAFSWRQDSSLDGGATWREGTMKIECSRPNSWTSKVEWSRSGEPAVAATHADDQSP